MYQYEIERPRLFTDEGQRKFLKVRDRANKLIDLAGAARMASIITETGGGDIWVALACVDRLVELGELVEVNSAETPPQFRIFRKP